MAKMKYWDGIKWVVLDAADADTVEGLSVAQIQSGTTKQDVELGNVDNVKQASKAEFDTHLAETVPHLFEDDGKIYRWGFRTLNGQPQFIYEEVV